MNNTNKGSFASKHKNATIDPDLSVQIQSFAQGEIISCAAAHKAASLTGSSPKDIGIQIDLMDYRLTKCQLGLFGYKEKKKLDLNIDISAELNKKIEAAAKGGKISCTDCWNIAKEEDITKLGMGSACEKKGLKIKPCQLGAF